MGQLGHFGSQQWPCQARRFSEEQIPQQFFFHDSIVGSPPRIACSRNMISNFGAFPRLWNATARTPCTNCRTGMHAEGAADEQCFSQPRSVAEPRYGGEAWTRLTRCRQPISVTRVFQQRSPNARFKLQFLVVSKAYNPWCYRLGCSYSAPQPTWTFPAAPTSKESYLAR
jgi:hypothetical protein